MVPHSQLLSSVLAGRKGLVVGIASEASIAMPLDVEQPGEMEAVFAAMRKKWNRLDFALHSIAFAPKHDLHGRVVESTREGFARAMDISCHSFICAFLVSDAARAITGDTHYIDGGLHILA